MEKDASHMAEVGPSKPKHIHTTSKNTHMQLFDTTNVGICNNSRRSFPPRSLLSEDATDDEKAAYISQNLRENWAQQCHCVALELPNCSIARRRAMADLTYEDMHPQTVMIIGPRAMVRPGPPHFPSEERDEGGWLLGREVRLSPLYLGRERWKEVEREARRKEGVVWGMWRDYVLSCCGFAMRGYAKWRMDRDKERWGALPSIVEGCGYEMLMKSRVFRKDMKAVRNGERCRTHGSTACFCVSVVRRGEEKVEELFDVRVWAGIGPLSKLPFGVVSEDMDAARIGEDCPIDEMDKCYCVAFYMKDELRLVDIKPAVEEDAGWTE